MTKAELVDKIAEKKPGLTRKQVEVVVNTVLDGIKDALSREDKVEIRGFGSFRIRHRRAKEGRNPKTGETVSVPPKKGPVLQGGQGNAGDGRREDIGSSPSLVYFNNSLLNRKFDQAGAGVDVELFADVRLMGNDGLDADAQHVGHFLVRVSLGNELQHLLFPVAQFIVGILQIRMPFSLEVAGDDFRRQSRNRGRVLPARSS